MLVRIFRIAGGVCAIALLLAFAATAAPLLLQQASPYTGSQPVAGWMMSEKLDGIRGYWDGTKLVTRKGRMIHAPAWFTENLPSFALDGELWRRRNDFAFVQRTVLDEAPSDNWKEITYNIFEVPDASGDFLARLNKAIAWFNSHPAPHVRIIEQIVCEGPNDLDTFLNTIDALGGEGVIVKDPKLVFHSGRRPYVLKVKNFDDMEGRVIAHNPGKGKFRGMMGSLTLRLKSNIEFNLGSGFTAAERRCPPPIGAMVTFKYIGFTENGIPRFASYLRVRKD